MKFKDLFLIMLDGQKLSFSQSHVSIHGPNIASREARCFEAGHRSSFYESRRLLDNYLRNSAADVDQDERKSDSVEEG